MWVFSVMVGKSLKNVLCPGIYKPITIKKTIAGFILKIKLEWPMRPLKIVLFLFYFFNLPYVALFLISLFWHVDFRESPIPPSPHSAPSRLPCAYEASSFSLLSESKRKKKNYAPSKQRNMYKGPNNRPPPFGPRTRPNANSCEHHLAMIPQKLANPVAVSYHAVLLRC